MSQSVQQRPTSVTRTQQQVEKGQGEPEVRENDAAYKKKLLEVSRRFGV